MKKRLQLLMWLAALLSLPAWAGLDINTAKQSELEAIRGLGPVKARAIIEYRETRGPFKSLDELDHVRGFGKASIDKLRNELIVIQSVPLKRKNEMYIIQSEPQKRK